MHARDPLGQAVGYAIDMLRQGAVIADVAGRAGLPFEDVIGPHLRHVVEHYETLLAGLEHGVVDYDNRDRDRRLECDPALAQARCETLAAAYLQRLDQPWPESVVVAFDGGVAGDERFVSPSTPLRELLFVAGHAVHHYALLRLVLEQQRVMLPAWTGKAPSTIRHEREQRA